MPISATGNEDRDCGRGRARARGFTLIELMVVLVVIALLSATVMLTLPEPVAGPEDEARRLAARLAFAATESVISGEAIGVDIDGTGYAFVRYRRGRWQPVMTGGTLARQRWEEATKVEIQRDSGSPVGLDQGVDGQSGVIVPELRFEPVGLATPFDIVLVHSGRRVRIVGDATGDIRIGPADETR